MTAFSGLGITLAMISSAATTPLGLEAEAGTRSGSASLVADSTASSGAAVSFGSELFIKDTSYDPAGGIFVATNGSDANSGTQASPYRTITKAVSAAPAGGKIVIRGGTYREAVPNFSKRLIFQPYPHEKVWIKGSLVVTGWVKEGAAWVKTGWTYEFCQTCYVNGLVTSTYPHAGKPDMVFMGGRPLTQVGSTAEVAAGKFYVDYAADKLYIGSDPTGQEVEASAYKVALRPVTDTAGGTIIRGLGFAHYASNQDPSKGDSSQIIMSAPNMVVENNTFAWGASTSLHIFSTGAQVRGNTFVRAGMNGIGGTRADNTVFEQNRVAYSNEERFSTAPGEVAAVAGFKIAYTKYLKVQDNIFENNHGLGYWCDLSCYDVNIVRNIARNNLRHGIYYEVSSNAIIASNLVYGNGGKGISISGSNNIRVYNNTLSRNQRNLSVYEDPRKNTNATELAMGIAYDTRDVVVKNNIMSNNDSSSAEFIHTDDYNATDEVSASDMITANDYNAYYRSSSTVPTNLVKWSRKGTTPLWFTSLGAFKTGTGREVSSYDTDGGSNPFFVDETSQNFLLKSDSPAKGSGQGLPTDVATAIGVGAGVAVDRGALKWPGR